MHANNSSPINSKITISDGYFLTKPTQAAWNKDTNLRITFYTKIKQNKSNTGVFFYRDLPARATEFIQLEGGSESA